MIENQEFNPEYIKTPTPKKFNRKILLIIPIIITIISLFIFLLSTKSNPKTAKSVSTPEPEVSNPIPTSSIQLPPSALSTDAAVLKNKQEIEDNINSANTIDLSESNLSFPILDFSIGFQ